MTVTAICVSLDQYREQAVSGCATVTAMTDGEHCPYPPRCAPCEDDFTRRWAALVQRAAESRAQMRRLGLTPDPP